MKATKQGPKAPGPAIVWLRQDLRLADNPALQAACRRGGPVVPVFVWAPEEEGVWPPGGASRWWLHHSLARLAEEFSGAGARLVIRQGSSIAELQRVAKATGADAVFWNRRYEPAAVPRVPPASSWAAPIPGPSSATSSCASWRWKRIVE